MLKIVRADGTAFERGVKIGKECAAEIRRIFECQNSPVALSRMTLREWLPKAMEYLPFIRRHTPTALAEMEGTAQGAGLPFEDILLLTCSYERGMTLSIPSRCTSFASAMSGRLICGQNNDESPDRWARGEADVLLHLSGPDMPESFIYTHPGIPAYMGMNEPGLCLLWMYIENLVRAPGAPSCAIIREVLLKRSLDEAVECLKEIPHAVPDSFFLAHADGRICDIEMSPRHFCPRWTTSWAAHGNKITEPAMIEGMDEPAKTEVSCPCTRHRRMVELIEACNGKVTVERGKELLSDLHGTDSINHSTTLASMVFDPSRKEMHIAMGMGAERRFEIVRLGTR